MLALALLASAFQMVAMGFDELVFHRRRGLQRWERLGHPLDTLSAALCYGWLVLTPPARPHAVGIYLALCAFSSVLITKDEFVHAQFCEPAEAWLHSMLFVLHPIVFMGVGAVWYAGAAPWLPKVELWATLGLFIHQLVYWSIIVQRAAGKGREPRRG